MGDLRRYLDSDSDLPRGAGVRRNVLPPPLPSRVTTSRGESVADRQVLIAGAGPTGLVLALWLAKSGIALRIVDKTAAPGTTSRAIVMHARNLEFYRQLGIERIPIEGGVEVTHLNLWLRSKRVGGLSF